MLKLIFSSSFNPGDSAPVDNADAQVVPEPPVQVLSDAAEWRVRIH